jgi:hypothetical protein
MAISKWSGRAGNNMAQLTGAVAIANATGSVVVALPHALLGNGSARIWDFRSMACITRQGEVVLRENQPGFSLAGEPGVSIASSMFFNRSNCEAVGLDKMSLRTRREVTLQLIAPRTPAMATPSEGSIPGSPGRRLRPHLVIHIRGGDIFSKRATLGRRRQYGQPPLAFYQRILIDGGYLSVGWPVTVLHEDDGNPVVGALKAWWPPSAAGAVQFVSGGNLADVVAALTGATHLVAAVSTLSINFGLLAAPHLVRVFIPFCRQHLLAGFLYDNGDDVPITFTRVQSTHAKQRHRTLMRRHIDARTAHGQSDIGISGFCYEFPSYGVQDRWMNTPAQLKIMVEYPESSVVAYPLPSSWA